MPTSPQKVEGFRKKLLGWYDRHRRVLPWRALPGQKPDPYHVSEVMLQQTTVPAVIPYFNKFTKQWPTVQDLAAASPEDVMGNWAGLGYYARARNLYKCSQVVSNDLGGIFPDTQHELIKLPGIGDYTSAAIAAIAYNKPANVVDGNVERVMARVFAVTEPVPDSKPLLKSLAKTMAEGEVIRPGDYAQALMDLGATICTPTSPKCALCPVSDNCEGRRLEIAASLPARKAKGLKPQKHGYVYWVVDTKGRVLLERRAEKGMLGSTLGLPTSEWVDPSLKRVHLAFIKPKIRKNVLIRHSFTHFDLELQGIEASPHDHLPDTLGEYIWVEMEQLKTLGFPTLFKKAVKLFE
jgi:A/G-specific adenine glycosylase